MEWQRYLERSFDAEALMEFLPDPSDEAMRREARAGPGQFLGSLAVDSGGYVCCASPGQGAILVFPPEGGALEVVVTPDF